MRRLLWLVTLTALVGCASPEARIAEALGPVIAQLPALLQGVQGGDDNSEVVTPTVINVRVDLSDFWGLFRFLDIGTDVDVSIVIFTGRTKDGCDHRVGEGLAVELVED